MNFVCKKCGKKKDSSHFSKHSGCKSGYDISRCKYCKKSEYDWSQVPLNKRIFNRAKSRAKKKGWDFNITLSDIIIPEKCPVFNNPLIYGDLDWTPSIDRINSKKRVY